MNDMYIGHPMMRWHDVKPNWSLWLWAVLSGILLLQNPSDVTCLIALGSLFVRQWIHPMSWPAFRWFVLLWVGVWANCYWEHELFAFDALRIPALGWVVSLGILPSFHPKCLRERLVDAAILLSLFFMNDIVSWDNGFSLSRNIYIFVVSIGLIAAGRHTAYQDLKHALTQLWIVVVIQSFVTGMFSPETAWIDNNALRFQGFLSNPNSLSHPFLILSMSVLMMFKSSMKNLIVLWTMSAVLLFFTGTRSAMLAFLLFSLIQFSLEFGWNRIQKRTLLIASLACAAGLGVLEFCGLPWMRIETLAIGGGWVIAGPRAIESWLEKPWMGHGAGYESQWFLAMAPSFEWVNHIGNSHNAFLALVMDYGVVGGLSLLGWMGWRFRWFANGKSWLVGVPLLVELFFENWLTAPMSSSFLIMAAASMTAQKLIEPAKTDLAQD